MIFDYDLFLDYWDSWARRHWKKLILLIVWAVIFQVLIIGETMQHEQAHAEFCKYFGGNATITYDFNAMFNPLVAFAPSPVSSFYSPVSVAYTQCDIVSPRDKIIMDGINEETSYQMIPIYVMVYLIGVMIILG